MQLHCGDEVKSGDGDNSKVSKGENQAFQKVHKATENIGRTEIITGKVVEEVDDELKKRLDVSGTLKEEPFVNSKPNFQLKNENQELHDRLAFLNTVDGDENKREKLNQTFPVGKEEADELTNGVEVSETVKFKMKEELVPNTTDDHFVLPTLHEPSKLESGD